MSGGSARKRRSPLRDAFKSIAERVGPALVFAALWLLDRTLRVEFEGIEPLQERWRRGERVILAFWHGRQIAMAFAVSALRIPVCIIVSQHRDGEIATRVLRRWGVDTARGSATRGGASAFLQLVRAHRAGKNLALAPDGPRGPVRTVKPGAVHLARSTGAVLVPVSFSADRLWRLDNWDRTAIPKPFARLLVVVGEPLEVARRADDAEVETARATLEARLNEVDRRADQRFAGG